MIRSSHAPSHRTALATVALVGLLLTSGCLGFLTGDQPLTVESNEITVSEDAQSKAGYDLDRKRAIGVNETVSAAGQEREVEATNHLAEYKRGIQSPAGDAAVASFTVVSTPKVEVAGQSLNPIGDRSNRELARRFQRSYGGFDNLRFVGNRTVQSLGSERTVSTYRADAQVVNGVEIDVHVHITKFAHGDDYVVAVAVHPAVIDQQERIDQLLRGLEHAE